MATQVSLNSGAVSSAGSLKLQTNGTTDAVTIDTSQNLGLGVTPSAWDSSIFTTLQIRYASFFGGVSSPGDTWVGANLYYGGGAYKYIANGYSSYYRQATGAHIWGTAASGTAGNAITFTQAMTLDASGNLGIGATSIGEGNLQITKAGLNTGITNVLVSASFANASNTTGLFIGYRTDETTAVLAPRTGTGNLAFYNYNGAWAETARFTNTGNLLVGTTSTGSFSSSAGIILSSGRGLFTASSTSPMAISRITTTGSLLDWYSGSTYIGSVSTNGSTITYGGTSDYRLKENVAPMTNALAKVSLLKPCTFTWKTTGIQDDGFIAHELAEVCPNAVVGQKDAVNEDGSIIPQQIDTSFLVATLTAAIQELNAKFETYKAAHP